MRRALRGLALLTMAVTLVVPTAASAKTYPPPVSQGDGTADPSRVGVGECTTFSGGGFAPLSEVAVTDDGHFVRRVTADSDGTFSAQVCFNSDAKPGPHTLEGDGVTTDGADRVVTAVVYVLGQSVSNPGHGGGKGGAGTGSTTTGGTGATRRAADSTPATTDTATTGTAADVAVVVGLAVLALGSALALRAERRHRSRRRAAVAG